MPYLRFDKKEKKWDVIESSEKLETDLFLAQGIKNKLDFAKKQKEKNNDIVGIVCGDEGSGKSSIAGNMMRYMCDDTFNPIEDMIGSDEEDAYNKLQNVKHGGNLMFDEGNIFFLSTETMKRQHRDLHKIFSIFRQKNLFVLIVLPSFFRLGTYFALDRSKFLIRTYLDNNGERGCFAYYGNKVKNRLYRIGKKMHDYQIIQPNFRGRFKQCLQLESEEYTKFKLETLKKSFSIANRKKVKTKKEMQQDYKTELIRKNLDTPSKELANILKLTQRSIDLTKQKIREYEAEQMLKKLKE
jgi:ABC-type dipeptide/oligopeptide/nickel transport system ATPase component